MLLNAGQLIHPVFDQPGTGGTTDAVNNEGGFCQISVFTLIARHKSALQGVAVVQSQGFAGGEVTVFEFCRCQFRQFGTVFVIVFQATGDDGFGNGFTARTAHSPGLAINND